MEPVHRRNDSENTQGFQRSIDCGLEATKVVLPEVIEKLKVGESPLEIECGSTNPGVIFGEEDSQGSGEPETVLSEDQKDFPLNAAIRSKKYSKITDEQRRDFIDAVENNGEKIIHAAKRFNINYSSAKSILNIFKSEGRSLKKMTRNRNGKDEDGEDIEDENNKETSGNLPAMNQVQKVTTEISTQTEPEGEPQQENYLLALRDRLLASKSEKRENPYSNLISHEATRYPENLKEFPQHQSANSNLSSYISLQGTPGSQNSIGGETKYFTTSQPVSNFGQQQQYLSGIQAQYYQQHQLSALGNQLNLSQLQQLQQLQEPRNNQNLLLNMSCPQTAWKASSNEDLNRVQAQAQQQSGNNFSSMSYTGLNQAQYTINQANDNQKGHIKYVQPVMYVMPPNVNQTSFGSPIFQNIQNFAPHQNTYLHYGQSQNQNQEEGQNHNPKRG